MGSTLYLNGVVHSRTDPFAEAVLVADGQIAWLGDQSSVHTVLDGADEVVDLDGALVAPAFVDAHTHLVGVGRAELAAGRAAPERPYPGEPEPWDLADTDERHDLYAAALHAAAAAGIVAVHEQSSPDLETRAGLAALIAGTTGEDSGWPVVLGYRAELCETVDDARAILGAIPGLVGLGALHLDGELSERAAALRFAYADAPGNLGELYLAPSRSPTTPQRPRALGCRPPSTSSATAPCTRRCWGSRSPPRSRGSARSGARGTGSSTLR